MKKIIFALVLMITSTLAINAKDFSTGQLRLRLDIFKYLTAEGFNPKIDQDGDISFVSDDKQFYAIINEKWEDPFIVTIYLKYKYSSEFNENAITNCLSLIEEYKTIKIIPGSTSYSYRTDIFCKDASVVTETFYKILKEMKKATETMEELVETGMASIDMTCPDSIFDKALNFYLKNEDKKAFKLFKMLEKQNYSKVFEYLASSYRYGYGTDIDTDKMQEYYKKGYELNGDMGCAYNLANYYLQSKNYSNAYEYFMKCANNDGGYKYKGLFQIGYMQENGLGIPSDLVKAKTSYRNALKYATTKDCDARKALMRLNETIEVKADFVDATKTMLANMTPEEMYQKGREYEYGLNKRFVSLPKAYAYYKAAAENGYTNAFLKMGEIYIDEYYPFNDKAMSDKWYQKAFKIFKKQEDKDGNACYQIGLMYENGYGVAKDVNKAKEYYLQGANLKDSKAAWKYGLFLKEDNEYTDAAKYFEQAAEDGNGDAMYELAYLYEVGYGVYQNRANAVYWYKKSYNTWDESWKKAKEALIRLGEYKVRN